MLRTKKVKSKVGTRKELEGDAGGRRRSHGSDSAATSGPGMHLVTGEPYVQVSNGAGGDPWPSVQMSNRRGQPGAIVR